MLENVPTRLSKREVAHIIQYYFRGYTVKEIAGRLGVSDRTIRNKISDFEIRVKEVGVKMAASEMSVKVDELHRMAVYKRSSRVEFEEISNGIKVASASKDLGCKLDDVKDFLKFIYEEVMSRGYSPDSFVGNAYRLEEARKKLELPYDEAIKEHESLRVKLIETQEAIKEAEEEKKKSDELLERTLEKNNMRLMDIENYRSLRESLKSYDIDIDDVEGLKTLIENVAEYYDGHHELVQYYTETREAKTRHQDTVTETKELEARKKVLEDENRGLSDHMAEMHTVLETAEILKETGITSDQARTFSNLVKEIASKNGYPRTRALAKLRQDIKDYYDPILGLENWKTQLEQEARSKTLAYEDLRKTHDRLVEENQNQINTINELRKLNSKGVSDNDIINWAKILEENNLDSHTLRREIKKLDGIKVTTRELMTSISTLNHRQQELEKEIATLENKREQLSSNVEQLNQQVTTKIDKLSRELVELVNKVEEQILSPTSGIKPRVDTLVKDAIKEITQTLDNYDASWENQFSSLSNKIDETTETVAKLIEKTYEAGKVFGHLDHLESVLKLCQGEPLSYIEANMAIVGLAITIQNHLNSKNLTTSNKKMQEFIETYYKEVTSIV